MSGHDLLLAVAAALSHGGPHRSPACQAFHEVFGRPKAVSRPRHPADLGRLRAGTTAHAATPWYPTAADRGQAGPPARLVGWHAATFSPTAIRGGRGASFSASRVTSIPR